MQERHSAGLDTAATGGKAASLDEIETLAEFGDKVGNLSKIVGIISIAHDDKAATGGLNAPHQSMAVALGLDMDDAGAKLLSNRGRSVMAAIIGHDNLAIDGSHRAIGLSDTNLEGVNFIQTRHHDRHVWNRRSHRHRGLRVSSHTDATQSTR